MATVVFFHAHPDDESIATGGTMAKLAAEGHRVVLVVATRGEHGEVAEGFLSPGEELWQRREKETEASGRALGIARGEFPARPFEPRWCRYCAYSSICRKDYIDDE